jgi:hypothetical protein
VREVRKAQGKAAAHKARVKAVSGPARSKKSQKRLDHKARMMEKDAAGKAAAAGGGDAAMVEAAGVARSAGVAVGRKQKLKIVRKQRRGSSGKGSGSGSGGTAADTATETAGGEPEGMQE